LNTLESVVSSGIDSHPSISRRTESAQIVFTELNALAPAIATVVVIPTPVGDYNPDWAIAFKEGAVKHVYFVDETKGSMSSMQLMHEKIKMTDLYQKQEVWAI
jgi:restriction endonuclease